jgi:hypothetical protein
LRDSVAAGRHADVFTIGHRALQGENIQRQQDQKRGMPVTPAMPRDNNGTIQAAANTPISKLRKSW